MFTHQIVDKKFEAGGALRGVFALAQKMTDVQLSTWRTMLEYEGYFDIWRDYFGKWSGTADTAGTAVAVGDSLYSGTIVES